MIYAELERQVKDLQQQAKLDQAISEINQFLTESHSREELDQADKLLRMIEQELPSQDAPSTDVPIRDDSFATALDIVRDEIDLGEYDAAFIGTEKLLREKPHHSGAQDVLIEIAQHDNRMQFKARTLLAELGLDDGILAQPTQSTSMRPTGPTVNVKGSEANDETVLPASKDDLFAKYQEAMQLYRSRYHEQAIQIFEEILHRAETGSQVHNDATEYRQKAEERLVAGEVPLDNIPFEALDNQSQATSAIRLGDYPTAMRLLDSAIKVCRQMKVRHPPEWSTQLQYARDIHLALQIKEKGDNALKEGSLDQTLQHWGNAQNVLKDPDLEQSLIDLKEARKAVIEGSIIKHMGTGQLNENQIKQLIEVLQSLQKAHATFSQVSIIEDALAGVQQNAVLIKERLDEQANTYFREAEQANTLSDRRYWLESAQSGLKLANALSRGAISPSINKVEQMLRKQVDLESLLKEAETVLAQSSGETADLTRVWNDLHTLRDVVPNDHDLKALVRQLRDRYLENAEWKLDNLTDVSDLRQAEEYVRIASDQFFGPSTEKLNSLRKRVIREKQLRQRKINIKIALTAIIGVPIFIGLLMITNASIVQPITAPTSTSTPTPTETFTPTPTSTPTSTSTPTGTPTPTPTNTPVILYGSIINQVWVYDEPSSTGQKTSFVLQNQPVEVIDSRNDSSGQEWYKIRWTVRDSKNEGWIQSDQVTITSTN